MVGENAVYTVAEEHKTRKFKFGKFWFLHFKRGHDHEGVFQVPIETDGSAGEVTRFTEKEIKEPIGLVQDILGVLYASGERERLKRGRRHKRDVIGKVDLEGAVTHFASRLKEPRGMAFDAFGNLYIADGEGRGRGRVIRFRAPPAPYITSPVFTNQNPLVVSGTTNPNSRVDLFLNDTTEPQTVVTEDGSFSFPLNLNLNAANFVKVFSTAHEGAGLTSVPTELNLTHDNTAPLITNLFPPNGSFQKNSTPTLSARFSDNLSGVDVSGVLIQLNGSSVNSFATTITADGFRVPLTVPLPEGSHTIFVSVADVAGNVATASSTFTVDFTPPVVSNLTPANGSVLSQIPSEISANFNDNGSGVDVASATVVVDGVDVTSQSVVSTSGFTLNNLNNLNGLNFSDGQHTVNVSVADLATNSATAIWSFTVSSGPGLDPIGDKTVNVGSTLSFTVTASGGTGPLTFSVTPLPLPANASFNAITGVFNFSPDLSQVGSFVMTFAASDDSGKTSETITISVPQPPANGVTAFSGRVLDANDFENGITTPVVGATVAFLGTGVSAVTDTQGNFVLSNTPPGSQVFDIATATANLAPDNSPYAGFREEVNLIAGVNNIISRPFFLPRIAVNSLTTVNPNFFTTVTNSDLGVSLTVPPGTAKDENGNNFTGELSISVVPRDLTPAELPEFLDPGLVVTIQPVGVTFSTPVPITFPNIDNLEPVTEVNIWSLNADLGIFEVVGIGLVSADGSNIETISGGIRANDWHFTTAQAADVSTSGTAKNNKSLGNGKSCNIQTTSSVCAKDGFNQIDHRIVSYRSLGISRSVTLNYSSFAAFPQPIIPTESVLSSNTTVPPNFSLTLEVGGVEQGTEVFYQAESQGLRQALSFDAAAYSTGRYPYRLQFKSNYTASAISVFIDDFVLVRNEIDSPIGAGWRMDVEERLLEISDGSLLLTSGDGTLLSFTPVEAAPPFTNFSPPPGDFSTLVRNPDGTLSRTLKGGTRISFNSQGLKTAVTDRNGNMTQFIYDPDDRLTQLVDPIGLVTTFSYGPQGKLQSITGPANRITMFEHDPQGNLVKITDPDGTVTSYAYDSNHLITTQMNPRQGVSEYTYGQAGRISSVKFPDSTVKGFIPSDTAALPDPTSGNGTPTNPAPAVPLASVQDVIADGNNNTTRLNTNSFGAVLSQSDALGQVTTIERDENSNPTKITRPNGAVLEMTYDDRGNLLTSRDPIGATTVFTYESVFNQVTSIIDPKGNPTTINYDTNGNPEEIIDALGNKTAMTYDSRGLLLTVTSAVGKPEENTTTFTYDAKGNLETTTDPLNNVTTLEYDDAGNVVKSTDAEGRVTEFSYDSMNRLVSVLDPAQKVTQYDYDNAGNLTLVTDAKNQSTTFVYDAMDRLVSSTNPLNLTETFTYDSNGNLQSTTNRNGQTLTFDYDALNRLVSKTLPPSMSQAGNQVTTFSYDSVGNLTQVSNPATTVFNQYDLANRLVSSTTTTEDAVSSIFIVINQNTLIDEDNQEFEGKSIRVEGRTLTVNGSHTFANLVLVNGAVLNHSPTTATKVGKMEITITNTLFVDANSRIDVNTRGFLGGNQPNNPHGQEGMTLNFALGSTSRSGGSYGGSGAGGLPNPIYGDFRDPNDVGSGGATTAGAAGNGGGLVRIVAQTIQLDGSIVANGGDGSIFAGGGSGGGIRIDAGTLAGTGFIRANGGRGGTTTTGNPVFPGGGGGRVAIFYQDLSGFNVGNISAFGGGSRSFGGAGTIYLQGPGREVGELIVDNNVTTAGGPFTTVNAIGSGSLELSTFRITRGSRVFVDEETNISGTLEISSTSELVTSNRVTAMTINLSNSSSMTHPSTSALNSFRLEVNATTVTIDNTSKIDVTDRGFLGGARPGNPFGNNGMTLNFALGSTSGSGSHGGFGAGTANPVYGDFRNPNEIGSGGSTAASSAGNGGGLVRIVAESMQLDGSIAANGGIGALHASGGSGGGIRIDAGTLTGTGTISADGGRGGTSIGGAIVFPGGGGGRVAVYYQDLSGFDISNISSVGGSSASGGGVGTIYLQGPGREAGEIILDNDKFSATGPLTPVQANGSGRLELSTLRVRRGARVRLDDEAIISGILEISSNSEVAAARRVIAASVGIAAASLLTHPSTTATTSFKVDVSTTSLTVDATSRIDVTNRGFLGGGQPGNPFVSDGMTVGFARGSTAGSAGSYGGLGAGAAPNPVYGLATDPGEVGSGGATGGGPTGNGGGLVRIVAETMQLEGSILADGGAGVRFAGAGSGGGIRIDVGSLVGTGIIRANGGRGGTSSTGSTIFPGGGGGRIAIFHRDITGFNQANIQALGGGSSNPGQPGSVHLQQVIAMLLPSDPHGPIMERAKAPIESPIQFASLNVFPVKSVGIANETGPAISTGLLGLELLISEMQSSVNDTVRPQRRFFSYQPKIQNPKSKIEENRYLALAAAKADDDFDPDPIYIYDLNGNRTSMIDPTGLTTYNYDELNRLTSITNNEGLTTTFTYDALGRRTSMTHDNGVVTTYSYDAASQLSSLVHQLGATTINSFTYTYDKVGNRKSKADNNGTANYTYDTLNRLVNATNPIPSNPLETFTYDAAGNRTDSNQNGLSNFNSANQLLDDADFTYTYDNNGNLTQKTNISTGAFTLYEYDAENKLIRVVREDGSIVNYRYDGLGRRIEKEVDSVVTKYIYDNEDILLELDGSNSITARYTHGLDIDEPIIIEKAGISSFYHADGLGSITELTNNLGAIVQSYTYSSFGKIEFQLDANFDQPYTFTARELDSETGLYHYRARALDSSIGRFLQQDPMGFAGGDFNLYTYVANQPVNLLDPLGLCICQKKTFFERVRDNFVETNRGAKDLLGAPAAAALAFARNLVTSGATARALNLVTPIKFILSGLQRLPTGVAPAFGASAFFSRPATAILAGTSAAINASLNFIAFEVGIGIGSLINAGFLEDECGRSIFFGR